MDVIFVVEDIFSRTCFQVRWEWYFRGISRYMGRVFSVCQARVSIYPIDGNRIWINRRVVNREIESILCVSLSFPDHTTQAIHVNWLSTSKVCFRGKNNAYKKEEWERLKVPNTMGTLCLWCFVIC